MINLNNPSRILLVGDTHANLYWWLDDVLPMAKKQKTSVILQLGDFGIWSGKQGEGYLDRLEKELELANRWLYFIDGNHEDFPFLYSFPIEETGLRCIRERIHHLPRGFRWDWSGKNFLACGGAGSIDMSFRIPGRTWWAEEKLSDEEIERCIQGGKTDVLISHNAPFEANVTGLDWDLPPLVQSWCQDCRERLQTVVTATTPSLVLHGHWHESHWTVVSEDYSIVGLAHENTVGSLAVLEPHKLGEGIKSALKLVN